jgi:hypothetical protein
MSKAKDGLGQPIDETAVYTCVDGFCLPDSSGVGEHWISAGMRLLGSHDAVRRAGRFFVRDGSDDLTHAKVRESLRPSVDAA